MEKKNSEYFCILGGGGIRGCSYTGTLKAIEELGLNITGWAGSSIGAVVATLYVAGYNAQEINKVFEDINIDFFKDINLSFGKDFALSKGGYFYDWIKDKIESKFYKENYIKGKMEPVTFEKLNKELVIFSVNLRYLNFHEFSKQKTPDAEIASAVRASVSMPGLYKPVMNGKDCLVDGDLIKCAPLWRASETIRDKDSRILEFRLEDNETEKNIQGTASYLNAVYNTISGFATDYIIDLYKDKDKFDYVKINLPNVSVVDFMISADKKANMAQIGYETTIKYFREIYPKKRKHLFSTYYEIELLVMKIQKLIEADKIKPAYVVLMELMSFLCENKKFIDIKIYDKILNFKNIFKENYKISKFLFLNGYALGEIHLVKALCRELIEILSKKTLELKPEKEPVSLMQ